jgi:hypothetical protein
MRLARVKAERAVFGGDDPRFPLHPAPYVVRGDVVIVVPGANDRVPAFFPQGIGRGSGCLPASALQLLPPARPARLGDWRGTWKKIQPRAYGDRKMAVDTIEIRVRGKALAIDGDAYWYYEPPDGANFGGIRTQGTPRGDMLAIDASDMPDRAPCPIRMQRLGAYLVVADEDRCNGQNATFSGVYRR